MIGTVVAWFELAEVAGAVDTGLGMLVAWPIAWFDGPAGQDVGILAAVERGRPDDGEGERGVGRAWDAGDG